MGRADDVVPIGELLDERRHLLEVAHGMLGGSGAAESVVDETYRRWYELSDPERAKITEPRSWLVEVVGSICLARLAPPEWVEGRESRRPTMKKPRPGPEDVAPADNALRSVTARRARPVPPHQHDALAGAVLQACATQDETLLASLLAPDATAFFDGGGKVRALATPVHGNTRVARSLLILLTRQPRTTLRTHSINGRTGLVARYEHQVVAVVSFDIVGLDTVGPHVGQVWVVLNPDKLRTWNRPSPCP